MRRFVTGIAIVLAVGLLGGSAYAGGSHISVPSKVKQGAKLEIRVTDCASGADFDAVIKVDVFDDNGDVVESREVDAEDDGDTTVQLKIKKSKYPKGRYAVVVTCIHHFHSGGTGTFFTEEDTFKVKKR